MPHTMDSYQVCPFKFLEANPDHELLLDPELLFLCYHLYSHFTESLTPLVLETQKQFSFSHIVAGATAMAKVLYFNFCIYKK